MPFHPLWLKFVAFELASRRCLAVYYGLGEGRQNALIECFAKL